MDERPVDTPRSHLPSRPQHATSAADAHASPAADRLLITVATYNEIENLPKLVDEIFHVAPQAQILVVDDNSPDGTGRWCDEKAAQDARLHCLHREGKLGLGTAMLAAFRYALDHNFTHVLNMDADFSHHPRHIPAILAAAQATAQPTGPPTGPPVDVVIGSRYIPGGGVVGWPLKRRLMSRAVNFYARWMLGLIPRDCSGAYRCYRAELLRRLDFDAFYSHGYSFQEEVLWRLKQQGARMVESPITFADREKGQSKINLGEAFSALAIIFRLGLANWLKWK